jgi:hypothetical protein
MGFSAGFVGGRRIRSYFSTSSIFKKILQVKA